MHYFGSDRDARTFMPPNFLFWLHSLFAQFIKTAVISATIVQFKYPSGFGMSSSWATYFFVCLRQFLLLSLGGVLKAAE